MLEWGFAKGTPTQFRIVDSVACGLARRLVRMMNLDPLLKAWDVAHWELGEAFDGMPDSDLWTRPHPRLLSVGEIAAHIASSEAAYFVGGKIETPLLDARVRYYPHNIESPFEAALGAAALYEEVQRIHQAARAALLENLPNAEATNPYREDWTWAQTLEYMVFHVAYHTGQVYSVRHILGHETVDN